MDATRILITGTGALASLFAAKLSAVGVHVTILGHWPEGLASLRKHGIRLFDSDGTIQSYPVDVIDDPAACPPTDYALVLVKSWQTQRTAKHLRRCLSPGGLALTLQNGLGNYETLAAELGPARSALGVTTTGATLIGPGQVRPGGVGYLEIGHHPRSKQLIELFLKAGFDTRETPDAERLVWSKLVINAAINPLTALLGIPNGQLLERPTLRSLMAKLALESAAVAAARGTSLTFSDPVAAAEDVALRTAENHSSMLQDVQRGAPTEIDSICGAIVREGVRLGVPTPINETFWQLVSGKVGKPTPS